MGAQMVFLGNDLIAVQLLGALEVGLGYRLLGRCLQVSRVRIADFQAIENSQRLPGLYLVAEVGFDIDDAPRDAWRHVRYAVLVWSDGGGQGERLAHFLHQY